MKRLAFALPLALLALPASAQDPLACADPAACVAAFFDRDTRHPTYMKLVPRLTAMDAENTVPLLAREAMARPDHYPDRMFEFLFEAAPELRRDVVWHLLQSEEEGAQFAAGRLIAYEDEDDIRERVHALPPAQAEAMWFRIGDGAMQKKTGGAAGLALLMDGEARKTVLSSQVFSIRSGNGPKAFQLLRRIDPARADARMRPRLMRSEQLHHLLTLYGGGQHPMHPREFAWFNDLWRDATLPEPVRRAAFQFLLDTRNPEPPRWTPEVEDMLQQGWHDGQGAEMLAVFGDDALGIVEAQWAHGPGAQQSILRDLAWAADMPGAASLDPARIAPMVAQGFARNDDFNVQEAAMVAWRKQDLAALDDLAQDLAARSPFDTVRHLASPDADLSRNRVLYGGGARKARTLADYCEVGTPILADADARGTAQRLGIPESRETVTGISVDTVTALYRQGDMTYFAYDRGEWGGGVVGVAPDGTQRQLVEQNVTFLAPIRQDAPTGPAWVFAGLNHGFARGSLQRLEAGEVTTVMQLPSAVQGLARDGEDYVLSFHDGDREPERWKSYHPPLRLAPDGTLSPACGAR